MNDQLNLKLLFCCFFCYFFCCFFIVLLSTAHASTTGKYALLIGIDDYRYMDNLAGQKADVYAIKKLLINHRGFKAQHITTLLDSQATALAIKNAVLKLQHITRAGDTVIIYFAGHGHQIIDKDGDEKEDGKDETLLAHDVSYNGGTGAPLSGYLTNTISDDQLQQWLDALNDRFVEVIVDACYSGTITRAPQLGIPPHPPVALAKKPLKIRHALKKEVVLQLPTTQNTPSLNNTKTQKTATLIPATPNRKVWTATSANEIAFVDTRDPNNPKSVFTHAYVEGFADKKADRNSDGIITDRELLRYIEDVSRDYCHYLQQPNRGQMCASLTPTLE